MIHDHLRSGFSHFHLVVDLSNLLGLFFQLRSELFNLLLLFVNLPVSQQPSWEEFPYAEATDGKRDQRQRSRTR
jgi:hypothetical protein